MEIGLSKQNEIFHTKCLLIDTIAYLKHTNCLKPIQGYNLDFKVT